MEAVSKVSPDQIKAYFTGLGDRIRNGISFNCPLLDPIYSVKLQKDFTQKITPRLYVKWLVLCILNTFKRFYHHMYLVWSKAGFFRFPKNL